MTLLPTDITIGQAVPEPAQFRAAYGKTYEFDFATGDFVEDGGAVALLDRQESLVQGLTKALLTRRYADLAYDGLYGNDVWLYLDNNPTDTPLQQTLLGHYVTETIVSDRRVVSVANLVIDVPATGQLHIEVDVTDIFGATAHLEVLLEG